jgi:hypothetical protein
MSQRPPVWARINREHALTRGLVGCWLFNEGGGTYAHDAQAGVYNRADLINGPTWIPGVDGPDLSFDGVDDYVKTTRNDFDLCANAASPVTFIAWINPTLSGTATRQGIVSVGEFNDLNFSNVFMVLSTTGELIWSIDPASTTASSGLITVANKWQFVAMVRTATEVRFFLGPTKAVVSNSSSSGIGNDPIIFGGAARNAALGSFYFSGKIGPAMVYNRALTDQEIQQLFVDPYVFLIPTDTTHGFVASGASNFSDSITETVSATDAYTASAAFVSDRTESAVATDAFSVTAAFASALSESVTGTDAWTATASFASALAESATATDSLTGAASFLATLTDTVTATESSVTGITASWSDSSTATDSISAIFSASGSETETVSASDGISAILQAVSGLTESVIASDQFDGVFVLQGGGSLPVEIVDPFLENRIRHDRYLRDHQAIRPKFHFP